MDRTLPCSSPSFSNAILLRRLWSTSSSSLTDPIWSPLPVIQLQSPVITDDMFEAFHKYINTNLNGIIRFLQARFTFLALSVNHSSTPYLQTIPICSINIEPVPDYHLNIHHHRSQIPSYFGDFGAKSLHDSIPNHPPTFKFTLQLYSILPTKPSHYYVFHGVPRLSLLLAHTLSLSLAHCQWLLAAPMLPDSDLHHVEIDTKDRI